MKRGKMAKMIVGRRVEYVEVYEIDTDKYTTIRDNLDLCQRILWCPPAENNELRKKLGIPALKLLNIEFDRVSENPIYPVPKCYLPKLEENENGKSPTTKN